MIISVLGAIASGLLAKWSASQEKSIVRAQATADEAKAIAHRLETSFAGLAEPGKALDMVVRNAVAPLHRDNTELRGEMAKLRDQFIDLMIGKLNSSPHHVQV